jgi:hypothetical protein
MKNKETKLKKKNRKIFLNEVGLNENEFIYICDGLGGFILPTDYLECIYSLINVLSNANEIFGIDENWGIDYNELEEQLLSLSHINILKLLIEVDSFRGCNSSDYDSFGIKSPSELLAEYLEESKVLIK